MKILKGILGFLLMTTSGVLFAQSTQNGVGLPGIAVNIGQNADLVDTLQLITIFTVLSLAPAFVVLCTSFTRIVVVLAFMRQALGTQNLPPNQLLIGFAIFLSIFVMQPTGELIYKEALDPYIKKTITITQAITGIEKHMRSFMSKQTRTSDIALFYDVTGKKSPNTIDEVPTHFLIPAYIISELKTAFQIGFLLYIPFLILDMVVASVLMAMGMMMLPPVVISLPFKLLLFVLVDGWQLVTGAVLRSFN